MKQIRGVVLRKNKNEFGAAIEEMQYGTLPESGELLVDNLYSCLNYKDALAIANAGPIVKGDFPFVPGIDLAGTVRESSDVRFSPGETVIATGGGLGEIYWGGLSTVQRIPSKWVIKSPPEMTARSAMALGTAGVTAMLAVLDLENAGVKPNQGEIIVTGATGGVGSLAILLLKKAGFDVVACTGKRDASAYLKSLGASKILDRHAYSNEKLRPLDGARWAGAVDTVGGTLLARIISQVNTHGAIAVCGLAGGSELNTTVFPFILRGINLLGIDSNTCPVSLREKVWERLAHDISPADLEDLATEIGLDDVIDTAQRFIDGRVTGRYIVKLNDD